MLKWPGHDADRKLVENETLERGLIFQLNGRKHRGSVPISLDWADVYVVRLLNSDMEVLKEFDDVYVDGPVDLIYDAVKAP